MQNIPTKVETDDLTSSEFNEIANELETSVTSGGLTLSVSDQEQISKSIALYIAKQNWSIDSGAANAYVLSVPSPFKAAPAYDDGMQIVFDPGNVNTGASTLNYNTIGVKSIYLNGSDLVGGELTNIAIVQYNLALDVFELIYVHQELFFDGVQVKTVALANFDITNLAYSGNEFSVATEETIPQGLFIKPDGLKVYILGSGSDTIYQYSLSPAWDISTATADVGKTFSVTTEDTGPTGLFIKPDGLKVYMIGNVTDTIYQYSLSPAWDISTATIDAGKTFSVATEDTGPQGLFFKPDGLKVYMLGLGTDTIYQYSLSPAWDISTATADVGKTFSVATEETNPRDIFIKDDGLKVYMVGDITDTIYQYTLTTAWDISTATVDVGKDISIASEATSPTGLFFKPDSAKAYIIGDVNDKIFEYDSDIALYV